MLEDGQFEREGAKATATVLLLSAVAVDCCCWLLLAAGVTHDATEGCAGCSWLVLLSGWRERHACVATKLSVQSSHSKLCVQSSHSRAAAAAATVATAATAAAGAGSAPSAFSRSSMIRTAEPGGISPALSDVSSAPVRASAAFDATIVAGTRAAISSSLTGDGKLSENSSSLMACVVAPPPRVVAPPPPPLAALCAL